MKLYTEPKSFEKGERVAYVPSHIRKKAQIKLLNGEADWIELSGVEKGVVSSSNNSFIFVKYDCGARQMVTGDEPYTAQATKPEDLIKI